MHMLCFLLKSSYSCLFFFFFQAEDGIRDLTVTGVQTCALPISCSLGSLFAESRARLFRQMRNRSLSPCSFGCLFNVPLRSGSLFSCCHIRHRTGDRKSTRLNSSHSQISYAVFCLKKKKTPIHLSWLHNPLGSTSSAFSL